MKVILEFDGETERAAHELAIHGAEWYGVVTDLDEWLRTSIKHGGHEEWQPVRDRLMGLVADSGLNLWP